jgi:hypothetical protein
MRSRTWVLALLALISGAVELRADHGSHSHANRYFGLGWGDGYHVGTNVCQGCGGWASWSPSCQPQEAIPANPPAAMLVPRGPVAPMAGYRMHQWQPPQVQPQVQQPVWVPVQLPNGVIAWQPMMQQPAPQPMPAQPRFARVSIP